MLISRVRLAAFNFAYAACLDELAGETLTYPCDFPVFHFLEYRIPGNAGFLVFSPAPGGNLKNRASDRELCSPQPPRLDSSVFSSAFFPQPLLLAAVFVPISTKRSSTCLHGPRCQPLRRGCKICTLKIVVRSTRPLHAHLQNHVYPQPQSLFHTLPSHVPNLWIAATLHFQSSAQGATQKTVLLRCPRVQLGGKFS